MKKIGFFSLLLLMPGCIFSKDEQSKTTKEAMKKVTTESGLQYEILQEGKSDGAMPKKGDMVTVHYTGTLTNGSKFDSSLDRGQPFSFPIGMGYVIKGWDEGVMGMKVGEKRRLTIPANLGYGPRAMGDKIPANSTLIFDVELLKIG
jgi:peptidylprolyl isomerase